MKKNLFLTMMAAVLLWMLPSCKPTEDPMEHFTDGVVVTTAEPSYITGSTAVCGAEVTAEDAGLLISIGVCWSKSENPTIDDQVQKGHKCSEPFKILLTNLESNTKYHVRGFAQYGTEYCYGEEKTFTTLDSLSPGMSPVTTLPAYDITPYSFACDVTVAPIGIKYFNVGVCYSQEPEFTLENCENISYGFLNEDHYLVCCNGLYPNTQYYYRGCLIYYDENDDYHCFYGDILNVTTLDTPLQLDVYTYTPYYDWWDQNVQASGYIFCNKPEVVEEVGFCYSTTNEYPQYESDLHLSAGTPTGNWYDIYEFNKTLYNPSANTKYYFRAYARYKTDNIQYGNVEWVDTY